MNNNNVAVIIQARTASTRLPGKVLLPFYNDLSILDIILTRLKTELSVPVIVATSVASYDDTILLCAERHGIPVFRGSENDVLDRFVRTAEHFKFNNVIRVCSDNPFLFSDHIKTIINYAAEHKQDYISFRDVNGTAAIKTHWGLFAEYVSIAALAKVQKITDDLLYHEHVTNYVYAHPEIFKVTLLPAPDEILSRTDLRFTIDTPDDFNVCQTLYSGLAKRSGTFNLKELILLADNHPELREKMLNGIKNFKK
jgi:spore coat polysaccharide biosynthesis protein SpsF (cytidylyltransferase family)